MRMIRKSTLFIDDMRCSGIDDLSRNLDEWNGL